MTLESRPSRRDPSSAIGKVVDKTTADIGGAVVGSVVSEAVGNGVKEQVDKAGKK
ncbi:hypothetical protein ACS247_15070 [Musicola paradisiaca]